MTYDEACTKARVVWDNQPGAHIMSVQTCEELANWLQKNPTILAGSPERNLMLGNRGDSSTVPGLPDLTTVTSWVKEHPLPSLAIAFVAGYWLKN